MPRSFNEDIKRAVSLISLRMPSPEGKILNGSEVAIVLDGWTNEKKEIKKRSDTMAGLANDIEKRLDSLSGDIPSALKMLSEAKRAYKASKNPIVKRRWAAKLIVRKKYYDYMRDAHKGLISNSERVRDAVEDAQIVYSLLENRIKDAEIYYRLNGQLKLVGKALIDARTKFPMPEIQHSNFEFTMESLEKEMTGRTDDMLIGEANMILGIAAESKTEVKDGNNK